MDVGDDGGAHGWANSLCRCTETATPAGRRRGRAGRGGGRGAAHAAARRLIEPAPVAPRDRTSARQQLERARDFRRRPARALGLRARGRARGAGAASCGGRRAALRGRSRRPVLAAAAAGAALSVALTLAPLPVSASRASGPRTSGSSPGWRGWAGDVVRRGRSAPRFAALGGALLVARHAALRPRAGGSRARRVVVAFGVRSRYAGPIVLDPLFNRFDAAAGRARRARTCSSSPAGRASTSARSTSMDASGARPRPTPTSTGLGRHEARRALRQAARGLQRDEVRLVVAHELGHVHYDDVPRGLLCLAIVAPFGMFAVAPPRRADWRPRDGPARRAALPASCSRRARACRRSRRSPTSSRARRGARGPYALELTGEPDTFIAFQRRIAVQNVSDPDPPALRTFLLGTHPTTIERIGAGAGRRARLSQEARRAAAVADLGQVLDALARAPTWSSCPPSRRSARA